jgi:ribosomal protein L37E
MIPSDPSVEFEFFASATNYLQINCRRCGGAADVEYRGLDPVMPQIRTACRKCGTSVTFKISNGGALKGFHLYPAEQVWNVCSI